MAYEDGLQFQTLAAKRRGEVRQLVRDASLVSADDERRKALRDATRQLLVEDVAVASGKIRKKRTDAIKASIEPRHIYRQPSANPSAHHRALVASIWGADVDPTSVAPTSTIGENALRMREMRTGRKITRPAGEQAPVTRHPRRETPELLDARAKDIAKSKRGMTDEEYAAKYPRTTATITASVGWFRYPTGAGLAAAWKADR